MQTRQGLQPGAPMGDNGDIYFNDDIAARIAASGTAWVRLNFRLGPNFKDWTEAETFGFSAMSCYDTIVNCALDHNLRVLGLLCNEAWPGRNQPGDWRANSAEVGRGTGHNPYIAEFVTFAASKLMAHFAGRISHWQIWNEPNASTTYLYPSNFAWLLRRCYVAARDAGSPTLTVVSGGLLSTHGMDSNKLTSSNTGADYLRDTYRKGKAYAGWFDVKKVYGSYPIDVIGQHLYIDQWSNTTAARIEQATSLVRKAYVAEEGGKSDKPIHITELAWANNNVDEQTQAANLKIAYLKLKQLSYTPLTYWFFLQDVPLAGLYHGLLRSDGSEKPAWVTFREINEIHVSPAPRSAPLRLCDGCLQRGRRLWQTLRLRLL
jgi:hypothetical protein